MKYMIVLKCKKKITYYNKNKSTHKVNLNVKASWRKRLYVN